MNESSQHTVKQERVVVVGGGYAGVRTALELSRQKTGAEVFLIDPKTHFEYHSTLYRVVTGSSVMEACISYSSIFDRTDVVVERDTIISVDGDSNHVTGVSGAKYYFDYLVLALGSESNYFGIPGLAENTFGFKSIKDAFHLRRHIEGLFIGLEDASGVEKTTTGNIVIVGAGATGVEIAGQVVSFAKEHAKENGFDPSFISVNLIEAKNRVIPLMNEEASRRVEKRLRNLGVNIFLNSVVEKDDVEALHMKSMDIDTKTVVWTAGVKATDFYSAQIAGTECNRRGCVKVGEQFQLPERSNVFVIGDGAQAEFGGMAQTADRQGAYVAKILAQKLQRGAHVTVPKYVAKKPAFVIPVGPNWAVVQWGTVLFSGYFGWLFRRMVDLKYFLSVLSVRRAFGVFHQDKIPSPRREKKPLSEVERSLEEDGSKS